MSVEQNLYEGTRLKTVKTILVGFLLAAGTVLAAQPPAGASPHDSVLLSLEGKVEVWRVGAAQWLPARTNLHLAAGDRVRTGLRSRAAVQLSDLSVLRLNQLTTIEIQPAAEAGRPHSLEMKSGTLYFFNRERPSEMRFRTPVASGAIRGTEFILAVAEDGRTEVTLVDGKVDLSNEAGQVSLANGEQGIVEAGQVPRKTAVIQTINLMQWALYYPGVLDPDELGLSPEEQQSLAGSLNAYRTGDLLAAQANYPEGRIANSPAERTYRAATLLAIGQVDEADAMLKPVSSPLADALREVVAAVKNQPASRATEPATATEWMARSYSLQARSSLAEARQAAAAATKKSPHFGFAWVRLAELEFSFGRTDAARAALEKGVQLSPRHAQGLALKGFVLAARNQIASALAEFDRAIAIDGGLGNAWLGRGLCHIRQGHAAEGRKDLQVAAALEPQRALFRSYLGKAWSHTRDHGRAEKELDLAKKLDPNDPTAWLYSALLAQQDNRVNEAVRDLERSQELNDNRSLFRSRLLLDQDRAVRSANLAGIYRDAGMTDVGVREAARAVSYDYANYSAHLFLADSYYDLIDFKTVNLRYETPWQSELLLANLLAPVGAAHLSQNVSQQEYSRLFQRDGLGLSSSTEYSSRGDWIQHASQHGTFGGTAYAIDVNYLSQRGYQANNDFEQTVLTGKFKQQLTEKDSLLFQVDSYDARYGDLAQYYTQTNASRTLRVNEKQQPNLLLGYHREWSPESHTLFLFRRLDNTFTQDDTAARMVTLYHNPPSGGVTPPPYFVRTFDGFGLGYDSELTAYSAELQQIWQRHPYTVIAGMRYQRGDIGVRSRLTHAPMGFPGVIFTPGFPPQPFDLPQTAGNTLERVTGYAYYLWQLCEPLQLTAGLSGDYLNYPRNSEVPPINSQQDDRTQVSPKAGFLYQPWKNTTFRGAYSRSLGGVYYDANVRLEPTQIAGFNQAFRSLLPESVAGLVPGTQFDQVGLGLDQKFNTGTYVGLTGEILWSSGARDVGVFNYDGTTVPPPAGATTEELDFRERSLTLTINQLVGNNFSLGARYRVSDAHLRDRLPGIPVSAFAGADRVLSATLHQLDLYALAYHRCGFFGEFDAVWNSQSNGGYSPAEPGDSFWQMNLFVGYRFARRHAEVRLGVLNLAGRDYSLNPLTLYTELPRERTFVASLKFWF
ncbi:MAG: FecR domain-containing protein [Verrucomicrobia bacterium]|nr:FecR domain-containing protein [Verrucomicrobiota bacterium]